MKINFKKIKYVLTIVAQIVFIVMNVLAIGYFIGSVLVLIMSCGG